MLTILFTAAAFAATLVWFHTCFFRKQPINWPVVGMLPFMLHNWHRLHPAFTDLLQSSNHAILLRFAWFSNSDVLMTADPDDVRYIMQTNSNGYIKGDSWRDRVDVFGKCILNLDGEEWRLHRNGIRSYLAHPRLHQAMAEAFHTAAGRLVIELRDASEKGIPIDLRDYLKKLMFRATCGALAGREQDTGSYEKRFSEAISDSFSAIMFRYILPPWFWRAQKWFGIGKERKLAKALETLNKFSSEFVSEKQTQISDGASKEEDFSYLKLFMTRHKFFETVPEEETLLRENFYTLLFAAEDTSSTTLAWFFMLLGNHPNTKAKIVEELLTHTRGRQESGVVPFGAEEFKQMVYLHAALCETLRLFPPVSFELREPVHADMLPTGHRITPSTRVVVSVYAMGRMKQVWGEDCAEFKPERWITSDGRVKHEPAHKFFAFNAGQRMCPGKEIAMELMKAAVANILLNYRVKLEQGRPVSIKTGILLQMEDALMAKIEKRSSTSTVE